MGLDAEIVDLEKSRKTLTRLGIWGTAFFVGLIVGYIYWKGGPAELLDLPFNNMGDFLAGVCAPLAFLWLVIGYRMQSLELEQNSKSLMQQAAEMRNAVEQATEQAQALRSSEALSRQSVINQTRQKYEDDLALLAAQIAMFTYAEPLSAEWEKFSSGDKAIFCKKLEGKISFDRSKWGRILQEPSIDVPNGLIDKMKVYVDLFESFMNVLMDICPDDFFVDFYQKSAFGHLKDDWVSLLEGNN